MILETRNTMCNLSNVKRRNSDIAKTATVCGFCFLVCLVWGGNILTDYQQPTGQFGSLGMLKQGIRDNDVELAWDEQHIEELEQNIMSMKSSLGGLTKKLHDEEVDLEEKNDFLRNTQKLAAYTHDLTAENYELKKLLSETIEEMNAQNIPIPQEAAQLIEKIQEKSRDASQQGTLRGSLARGD